MIGGDSSFVGKEKFRDTSSKVKYKRCILSNILNLLSNIYGYQLYYFIFYLIFLKIKINGKKHSKLLDIFHFKEN